MIFKHAMRALIICIFMLPAYQAMAQDDSSPPIKIALINIQNVETESIAWKSLSEQINARREKLKTEIQLLQSTLEEKAENLDSQRELLSPEAFAVEVNAFKKERATLDQVARSKKQTLDRAYLEARGQIRNALNKVVANFVQQEKITLVLKAGETESSVYSAAQSMFIDSIVLELLNKEIQAVVLPAVTPAQ